jgi:hypothetical protein
MEYWSDGVLGFGLARIAGMETYSLFCFAQYSITPMLYSY